MSGTMRVIVFTIWQPTWEWYKTWFLTKLGQNALIILNYKSSPTRRIGVNASIRPHSTRKTSLSRERCLHSMCQYRHITKHKIRIDRMNIVTMAAGAQHLPPSLELSELSVLWCLIPPESRRLLILDDYVVLRTSKCVAQLASTGY